LTKLRKRFFGAFPDLESGFVYFLHIYLRCARSGAVHVFLGFGAYPGLPVIQKSESRSRSGFKIFNFSSNFS